MFRRICLLIIILCLKLGLSKSDIIVLGPAGGPTQTLDYPITDLSCIHCSAHSIGYYLFNSTFKYNENVIESSLLEKSCNFIYHLTNDTSLYKWYLSNPNDFAVTIETKIGHCDNTYSIISIIIILSVSSCFICFIVILNYRLCYCKRSRFDSEYELLTN